LLGAALQPQCIETAAVCNSKMPIGTDSVNLFGIWNKPVQEPREDEKRAWLHCLACNPRAMAGGAGAGTSSVKNEWVASVQVGGERRTDATDCGNEDSAFPPRAKMRGVLQVLSCHFCASQRHLSAASTASDESWSLGRPEVRLTCLSVRCLSSYLIFPPVPVTSKLRSGSPSKVADARPDGFVRRPKSPR
jgi:hypothetical protein